MRSASRSLSFFLVLSFALGGCRGDAPEAPPVEAPLPSPSRNAKPKEDPAAARAAEARDALSARMMGRVMEAVKAGGHASAVKACNEDAPKITAAVAEEFGVNIGRTAERVRNPDNAPPEWVAERIRDRPETPIHAREQDGTLRALFPIFLAEPCLACHGKPEELAPGVAEALAEHYPNDRATGFSVGDLRGWLWVEVPPA